MDSLHQTITHRSWLKHYQVILFAINVHFVLYILFWLGIAWWTNLPKLALFFINPSGTSQFWVRRILNIRQILLTPQSRPLSWDILRVFLRQVVNLFSYSFHWISFHWLSQEWIFLYAHQWKYRVLGKICLMSDLNWISDLHRKGRYPKSECTSEGRPRI